MGSPRSSALGGAWWGIEGAQAAHREAPPPRPRRWRVAPAWDLDGLGGGRPASRCGSERCLGRAGGEAGGGFGRVFSMRRTRAAALVW